MYPFCLTSCRGCLGKNGDSQLRLAVRADFMRVALGRLWQSPIFSIQSDSYCSDSGKVGLAVGWRTRTRRAHVRCGTPPILVVVVPRSSFRGRKKWGQPTAPRGAYRFHESCGGAPVAVPNFSGGCGKAFCGRKEWGRPTARVWCLFTIYARGAVHELHPRPGAVRRSLRSSAFASALR